MRAGCYSRRSQCGLVRCGSVQPGAAVASGTTRPASQPPSFGLRSLLFVVCFKLITTDKFLPIVSYRQTLTHFTPTYHVLLLFCKNAF